MEPPPVEYGSAYLAFSVSTGAEETCTNMLTSDPYNPSLTAVPQGVQTNK